MQNPSESSLKCNSQIPSPQYLRIKNDFRNLKFLKFLKTHDCLKCFNWYTEQFLFVLIIVTYDNMFFFALKAREKLKFKFFAKISLNLVYLDNFALQHWNFNVVNTLFWICKWIKSHALNNNTNFYFICICCCCENSIIEKNCI